MVCWANRLRLVTWSRAHYGSKEPRIKMWILGHSLVGSFVPAAHSFALSAPLALLAHSTVIIRLLAPRTHLLAPPCLLIDSVLRSAHLFTLSLTHSRARGKMNDSMSQNNLVLSHSAYLCGDRRPKRKDRMERTLQRPRSDSQGWFDDGWWLRGSRLGGCWCATRRKRIRKRRLGYRMYPG